jgi:hypothetical protein
METDQVQPRARRQSREPLRPGYRWCENPILFVDTLYTSDAASADEENSSQ